MLNSLTFYLKTVPTAINRLAMFALSALFAKLFFLDHLLQSNPRLEHLGLVIEAVLASILASYVFYLIVVHIKQIRDRQLVEPHLHRWIAAIVGGCEGQLRDISTASNIKLDFATLTQADLKQAFANLQPYSNAPLLIAWPEKYATWLQYFEIQNRRTRQFIKKILSQILFVDPACISALLDVEDCSHVWMFDSFPNITIKNQDLTAFAPSFFEYCLRCRKLKALQDVGELTRLGG